MRQESCVWTARITRPPPRRSLKVRVSAELPGRATVAMESEATTSSVLAPWLSKIPSRPSHRPSRRRLRSTMLRLPDAHSLEPAQRTPSRIEIHRERHRQDSTPSSKSFAGILTSTKPTQPDASRCIVNQDESSGLMRRTRERHHEEQRDKGKTKRSPSVPSFSVSEHHRRFGEYRSAGKKRPRRPCL